MHSPLIQVGLALLIAYVFYLWLTDFRTRQRGGGNAGALPGSSPCPKNVVIVGILGALALVAGETYGEYLLGVSAEQSSMTILFAVVSIASAFGEELIFRGYLVVENRGKAALWLSIFGFSALFSMIHPFLWQWEEGIFQIQMSGKAWFSTAIVFINSLWFYGLRFSRWNPQQSLWPCIAAHASSNAAVFLTKLAQGHVSGIY